MSARFYLWSGNKVLLPRTTHGPHRYGGADVETQNTYTRGGTNPSSCARPTLFSLKNRRDVRDRVERTRVKKITCRQRALGYYPYGTSKTALH